jgi:hypothetical protein
VAFLNFDVASVPDLSNVYPCGNPSSPSPHLYMDLEMVMMPKNGGPEGCARGRKHREHKRD